MTQILYIDPNSELGPHKEFIQKFFEDNVPDYKYRFATDEECENLICVTNYPNALKPKSFRKISCEYLQNILNDIFHVKTMSYEEKIEIFSMCLSSDRASRGLGVSLLCKFAFPGVCVNFLQNYTRKFAIYILSENETISDLGRMYKMSFMRDHFKNQCIEFFRDFLKERGSTYGNNPKRIETIQYLHMRTMLLDHFGLTEKQNG